jgi:hypothetical protein
MSDVSTNEIPFVPKLSLQCQDRLKSFARSVQRLGQHAVNSPAWYQKLTELRTDACDHRQAVPISELKLMVAKNLLLDLAIQGWSISIRGGSILLVSHSECKGELAKEVIRNRHLQERDAQLRESSVISFVQSMERRRLTSKGWHSVFSVMRDGRELAESLLELRAKPSQLEAKIGRVIDPYIQFVETGVHCKETGLLLSDIWRYFRHTWVTAYKSIPGRSLSILIRDRAKTGHPVIGIAALGSAVVQQSIRDKWIGWDVQSVESALGKCDARVIKRLLTHLERRINLIYKSDLLGSMFTRWDLKRPSSSLIEKLNQAAEKAMRKHRLYPDPSAHKKTAEDDKAWRKKAELHLFRSKRCKELARLLSIKSVLLQSAGESLSPVAIMKVIEEPAVRHALAQIVRLLKAENVGIHMMDITICGAVAPYNAILGGKLVCTLLCSPEVVDYYRRRYARQVSVIASSMAGRAIRKKPHLSLLCTTSLYGSGSSQYNRIKITVDSQKPPLQYEELGTSEGFGSFHFSKECVRMVDILLGRSAEGKRVNSIFGEGVNPLMRKMREVLDLLELPSTPLLRHGNKRIVYGVPLAENFRELLMGMQERPRYLIDTKCPVNQTRALAHYWTRRWLRNRIANDDVLQSLSRHTLSFPMEHGAIVMIERRVSIDNSTLSES